MPPRLPASCKPNGGFPAMSMILRLFFFVLFFAAATLPGGRTQAAPIDDALAGFASSSYNDIEKAIESLVASGHPTAHAMLKAMEGGKLMVREADKAIVYKDASDKVFDARTGQAVTGDKAEGLRAVRVNNRVRRAVTAAIGSLSLLNPSADVRKKAAEAVFKSRDAGAIELLDGALAKETDSGVKTVMEQARAAAVLASDRPEKDKLAAVAILAKRGDLDTALEALSEAALRSRWRRPPPRRSRPSRPAWRCGQGRKASITESVSGPCCCWRRSGSPSPSA